LEQLSQGKIYYKKLIILFFNLIYSSIQLRIYSIIKFDRLLNNYQQKNKLMIDNSENFAIRSG